VPSFHRCLQWHHLFEQHACVKQSSQIINRTSEVCVRARETRGWTKTIHVLLFMGLAYEKDHEIYNFISSIKSEWPPFVWKTVTWVSSLDINQFARCKQHWSRSTSCFSFLTLHESWDKIQPTEHIKLNQNVKQTSLRCFLNMWNKENSYKRKQQVFLDQCCLHLAKWSLF